MHAAITWYKLVSDKLLKQYDENERLVKWLISRALDGLSRSTFNVNYFRIIISYYNKWALENWLCMEGLGYLFVNRNNNRIFS